MPGLTFSNELISRDGLHTDFACRFVLVRSHSVPASRIVLPFSFFTI
jgi:hypothetical protein